MLLSFVGQRDHAIDLPRGRQTNRRSDSAIDDNWSMLQLIAENYVDLLSVEDGRDVYVYVSPNSVQLFGWQPRELRGASIYSLLHAEDIEHVTDARSKHARRDEVRVRYRLKCRSGEYRWVESRSRISEDGLHIVTATRDIHEAMEQLHRLERMASYDSLTNLLNRRATEMALDAELQRSRRHLKPLSLAFFDVDRFKRINDTQGHNAGDLVLRDVSLCIERAKRTYDVLGRWGGDEFALLLPDTDADEAADVVHRIRRTAAQAMPGITLSFGISSNADADSADDLLAHADAALYRGKILGGNQVVAWRAIQ